ncbi:MAG: universal stress protein [Haloarculaceae archaeon]
MQLLGILGGLVLIPTMGPVALAGAVGILLAGAGWYRLYGRAKTEREGAALDALRGAVGDRALAETERVVADGSRSDVLVAIDTDTPAARERALLTVAGTVASHRGGRVRVVSFEAVPEQVTLSSATEETPADRAFERQTEELAASLSAPVETEAVVTHDVRRAVANYADDVDAGLLVGSVSEGRLHDTLLGHDVDWFMEHFPCDAAFVRDRGLAELDEVAVLAQRGPHGPLKVALAGAMAATAGATVRFVTALDPDASDELRARTEEYHAELRELCVADTASEIVATDDVIGGLVDATRDTDVALVGHDPHTAVHDLVLGDLSNDLADELPCTVLQVHADLPKTFVRRVVKRAIF